MSPTHLHTAPKAAKLFVSLLAFLCVMAAFLATSEAMVCEEQNSSQLSDELESRVELRAAPSETGVTCQGVFDEECDMGSPSGTPQPPNQLLVDDLPSCLLTAPPSLPCTSSCRLEGLTFDGELLPGFPSELFRPPPLR